MSDAYAIRYFLGANSPQGFYSLYSELLPPETASAVYILKGGPGCGKSTLMGRVAEQLARAGETVEYILCSGDPASLDGVVLLRLGEEQFTARVERSGEGVLLLSVAISFGYAAQSTYYSELPSVEHYGGGRAMGIYSLFENIGQTIGPMIYGLAMMLGYRSGLGLIGGAMLALLLLFLACNGKKKDS